LEDNLLWDEVISRLIFLVKLNFTLNRNNSAIKVLWVAYREFLRSFTQTDHSQTLTGLIRRNWWRDLLSKIHLHVYVPTQSSRSNELDTSRQVMDHIIWSILSFWQHTCHLEYRSSGVWIILYFQKFYYIFSLQNIPHWGIPNTRLYKLEQITIQNETRLSN